MRKHALAQFDPCLWCSSKEASDNCYLQSAQRRLWSDSAALAVDLSFLSPHALMCNFLLWLPRLYKERQMCWSCLHRVSEQTILYTLSLHLVGNSFSLDATKAISAKGGNSKVSNVLLRFKVDKCYIDKTQPTDVNNCVRNSKETFLKNSYIRRGMQI